MYGEKLFGKQSGSLFQGDSFGQDELVDDSASSPTALTRNKRQQSKRNSNLIGKAQSTSLQQFPQGILAPSKFKPRENTVIAVTDCQLLELDARNYFTVFNSCPTALMPQTKGALEALKMPTEARSELQLGWIRNFMSQQRFLSQLPTDSIEKLAKTVTVKTLNKGEYGACANGVRVVLKLTLAQEVG